MSSSLFGICVFRFTGISFSFRESKAIFTDLSFFTVITAGLTKQFSLMFVTFSMCPFFFSFSISLPTAGCRCIGIGRHFCCIHLASGFSSISTSIPFIVLFSWNSFFNFLFNSVVSGSSFTFWIFGLVFSISSFIPSCFIQSSPSNGFVFFRSFQ